MKKTLLATSLILFAFATPSLAGQDCTAMLTKIDASLETTKAADDAKAKIMQLRDKGAKAQAAGDEKTCSASAKSALEMLAK